jgi:hypothetical protein
MFSHEGPDRIIHCPFFFLQQGGEWAVIIPVQGNISGIVQIVFS